MAGENTDSQRSPNDSQIRNSTVAELRALEATHAEACAHEQADGSWRVGFVGRDSLTRAEAVAFAALRNAAPALLKVVEEAREELEACAVPSEDMPDLWAAFERLDKLTGGAT